MDGDIELRLKSIKSNLDELTKELQYLLQREVESPARGGEPNTQPFERCVARISSATLMLNNIVHDLSVVKLSVATLYDMLGCKGINLKKAQQ